MDPQEGLTTLGSKGAGPVGEVTVAELRRKVPLGVGTVPSADDENRHAAVGQDFACLAAEQERATPRRPCEAMTMGSARSLAAASRMPSAGKRSRTCTREQATPTAFAAASTESSMLWSLPS